MAGKIIADIIESAGSQITLNVGNVTILTASSTGLTLTPTNNVNINVANSNVTFTTANVTGVATFSAGSNTAPSITTSGDTNTGLYFPAADTIAFTEGGVESMRIDSSGNVGIGTASPTSQLHLAKALSSTQTNMLQIQNTGIFTWGIGVDNAVSSSSLLIQSGGAGGTTRLALDSSGNLLVGTTSQTPGYGNTNTGQQLGGSSVSTFSRGATDFVIVCNQNTPDGSTYYQMQFRVSNVSKGSITSTASATAYNTSSDYRLKENIAPMTGALAKVTQLKPVTYKWKEDGSDGEGFIAHELAEVKPDCVTGEKDAVDENGDIKPQGIDTSFLVATLTAAIQELKVIVDAQAVEIAALKAK